MQVNSNVNDSLLNESNMILINNQSNAGISSLSDL